MPTPVGAGGLEAAGKAAGDETALLLPGVAPAGTAPSRQGINELSDLRKQLTEHAQRIQDLEQQLEAQRQPQISGARSVVLPDGAFGLRGRAVAFGEDVDDRVLSPRARPRAGTNASTSSRPPGGGLSPTHGGSNPGSQGPNMRAASIKKFDGSTKEEDPFTNMWQSAKFNKMAMFDQDLLKSIYDKPYREASHQAAMLGCLACGLLAMPFGPIGMAAGGMFGALVGLILGVCMDKQRRLRKVKESEQEKRRLKSLVRWAAERFSEDESEEALQLIEMVTLEFKPISDIAAGSKNARKLLKLLDSWVAQRSVSRALWAYMDSVLQRWQSFSRQDFIRAMTVFQTLSVMYKFSSRQLDEQETSFLARIERLLEHSSVKAVMAHAQLLPTTGESRVMESMVFADHSRSAKKKVTRNPTSANASEDGGPSPAAQEEGGTGGVEDEDSDEADDIPEYGRQQTNKGELLVPANAEVMVEPVLKKVLKKPFFKNWDDFMEFDLTFKHKMPITLSEFNLLAEKETESSKGWDVCVDRKEIRVAKIQTGIGIITLRAWATVPGVNLYVAFYLFHNFNERVKWDKAFDQMFLVGQPAQGSDILYSLLKVPGVTPRDFLQYRRARVQEDGTILLVLRSAEHPDMPEKSGYIRAESHSSGYVLRQIYENGVPCLSVFLMSCADIKGLIPKFLINMVAPKKPAEWVENLRVACTKYQESHPNYMQELEEYINRYKQENPYDYEYEEDYGAAAALQPGQAVGPPTAVKGVGPVGELSPSTMLAL